MAESVYPFARDVQQKRAAAIIDGATPAQLDSLETDVKARPDDLLALQRFDYVLAGQGQYPRIIAAWTEYLSRHPDSARAYQERSGAYYNSGKRAEARADAAKACELGSHEACGQFRLWMAPTTARAK